MPSRRYAALLVALLGLAGGAAPRAQAQEPASQDSARVTMPDLTGLTLPEATRRLAALGLEVAPPEWVAASAPAATVVRQWPEAGSSVAVAGPARPAARLTLATASGQEPAVERTVPDLSGRKLDEARQLLEEAGLKAGEIKRIPGEAAESTVVGQGTAGGAKIPAGSGVDLQVSEGPAAAPTGVEVPDLVGKTIAQATALLAALKLRILRVDSEATTSGAGKILRQLPLAGSRVAESTGIALVQGVAASPAGPTVAPGSAGASRAQEAPATQPLPWRRIVRVLLVLAAAVGLAAVGLTMRRRWPRQPAPTETGRQPESFAPPATPTSPPSPAFPGPAAVRPPPLSPEAAVRTPPLSPGPAARTPQLSPGALRAADVGKRPPSPGSPAADAIRLSTVWDLGSTTLEVAGSLEASPAVPLLASGEGNEAEAPAGSAARRGQRLPSVRAVLAAGEVASTALGALGATLSPRAVGRVATGAVVGDELGSRILSAVLTALEIPLARVLADGWSSYDGFHEYLDPTRCPPERISAVTLAAHTLHARFRPVVELWLAGRLGTTLHADVELTIALESGILWIQAGRFIELRPGQCKVWGAIRCEDATLLVHPLAQLTLPSVVRFGQGLRINGRELAGAQG